MSDLVWRIQRAILGSAGPEKVRAVLTELQIPGGRTPVPGAYKRVRKCLLYAGCTEEEMREAFADTGVTGIDPVEQLIRDLLREGGEEPTA